MKQLTRETILHRNRIALILTVCALALAVLCISLPLCRFSTTVYTKKSSNTFVGDEKYKEARAEAEEAAAEREKVNGGKPVTILETVTERTNSSGKQTSMVTFRAVENSTKTGWQFIASGLASGRILLICLLCGACSIVLMMLSVLGKMDTPWFDLPARTKRLRRLACWLLLAAFFLMPVFLACNNLAFIRYIKLAVNGVPRPGTEALLQKLDVFLYGNTAGEAILDLMSSVQYDSTAFVWIILGSFAVMLFASVIFCEGEIQRTLLRGLLYLFVIALCVVILYPYYVMLITAFRNYSETTDMYFQNLLPTGWIWSNLKDIINRGVLRYLGNSLILSLGATAIAMLCGIPAAYALARMRFKGKRAYLGFVIMSQMFSPVVLLVGISQLMNSIRLNNTLLGLVMVNAAFNQAFAIWLLRGTFISISSEMEQAAQIDGCSTVGALLRVLIPMAAPGIVTTLIFVFINAWNEYTISTVLISTDAYRPITVGITQFSSFNMIEWQYLFAAALIATIPVVILFMCIEKHLAAGLTAGGVKG